MLCLWMSLDTTEEGKTKLSIETRDAKGLGAVEGLGTWLLPPGAAETPRRVHGLETVGKQH